MGRYFSLFSVRDERFHFGDLDLLSATFLSLKFLTIPSSPPFALSGLGGLFLTVQSEHRFLQSFFVFEIEFDIDNESLVLESLWF